MKDKLLDAYAQSSSLMRRARIRRVLRLRYGCTLAHQLTADPVWLGAHAM